MFTLVAFSQSLDEGGLLTGIDAVQDQTVKAVGKKITVPPMNKLIGLAAMIGSTGIRARIVSPSLRRINPIDIQPVTRALVPQAGQLVNYQAMNPIELDVNESLECEVSADPVAAERHTVIAILADGPQSPVTGSVFTVLAEVTVAQTAGTYAFADLVFPDDLPVGDYAVVGARLVCAGGVAFRFVPVGYSNRPGGLCAQDPDDIDPIAQRFGNLGEWLVFNTTQPPGIEVLGSAAAASATYNLYMDVLKKS